MTDDELRRQFREVERRAFEVASGYVRAEGKRILDELRKYIPEMKKPSMLWFEHLAEDLDRMQAMRDAYEEDEGIPPREYPEPKEQP